VTPALHLLLFAWALAAGVMALLWALHLPMRNAAIVRGIVGILRRLGMDRVPLPLRKTLENAAREQGLNSRRPAPRRDVIPSEARDLLFLCPAKPAPRA